MTTKHTPGPWTVENASDRMLWVGALRVPDDERYGLHTIITGIDIEDLTPEARAKKEADANLIAAAPDLLAACEALLAGSSKAAPLARIAIAKAKGEMPWLSDAAEVADDGGA